MARADDKPNGVVNGHGTYSVPSETNDIFHHRILSDQRIREDLPQEIDQAAAKVHFTGSSEPSLPINWRLAEAISSLKGLEAALVNVLIRRKYGSDFQDVTINTDHATLIPLSNSMWTIDPGEGGLNLTAASFHSPDAPLEKYFPNGDIYRAHATTHRSLASNIYRCKDGRDFNIHTDMNPDPTLDAIGLPHDTEASSIEEGAKVYQTAVSKIDSAELQHLVSDVCRQSGAICLSAEEFNASEHGKANTHVGLWEIYDQPSPSQPASWWPSISSTSQHRPLAGLKVVDMTRVIAAPAVTRSLAELGASIMRVTAPHLPDATTWHADLNWGKWNCTLDLRQPSAREKLKALVLEADVVVQGYRPGVLDKYGFGQQDIINLCSSRPRGIISVRENCYGWHGPWSTRSGWQQISDAVCGASVGYGNALGHGEAVQPIFPHSDYATGTAGACAILIALLRRSEQGGSYTIDLALNYYTTWLVNSVGEYPRSVFEKVWAEHDNVLWRSWHANPYTSPYTVKALRAGVGGKRLFKEEFFEERQAPGLLGKMKFRHVRPVAQWPKGTVELGYRIGTRGNGVDAPRWPEDLSVEIVT